MLPTIVRRAASQSIPKVIPPIYINPYKAKRLWPPDFSKISPKHQFRLERRYRRRTKLKWARPRWTKAVKLVQFGSIVFVAIYGVLFLDWQNEVGGNPDHRPFQGIRDWFFGLTGSIFSKDHLRRAPGTGPDEPNNAAPPVPSSAITTRK